MRNDAVTQKDKDMELEHWEIIRDALQDKLLRGTKEEEDLKVALTLSRVEREIVKAGLPEEAAKEGTPKLVYMTDEALDVYTYSVCGVCSTPIAKGDSYCTTHDSGPDNIPCIMCGDKSTGIGRFYCDSCRSKDGKL